MKHFCVFLNMFCLVILLLMACAPEREPDAKQRPAVTPEYIWNLIIEDQPYQDWSTFPAERIPAATRN